MSAERRKSRTPSDIPTQGDPDRKRVLNVLAQRRYRQRRREKIAALEAQAEVPQELAKSCPTPFALSLEPVNTSHPPSQTGDEASMGLLEAFRGYDDTTPTFMFDQDPLSLEVTQNFQDLGCLPSPIPSTPLSSSLQFPLTPDGAVLSIPILDVFHAVASIATAFHVIQYIWDPSHLHVLPRKLPPAVASLPPNLHPVPAQFTIPHHPTLDLLPWPSVREKLICMLSLPSALRPPIAQEDTIEDNEDSSPCAGSFHVSNSTSVQNSERRIKQSTAIVQLMQDLDDFSGGEGVRVHSNTTTWNEGNELVEESWEIGNLFYQRWWWCLDQRIVEVSNRRRRERGLPRLRLAA